MQIINVLRQRGKTTFLILISAFSKYRIITPNVESALIIEKQAKKLNLNIPKPLSFMTYSTAYGLNDKKILIDEFFTVAKMICEQYFTVPIFCGTMSVPIEPKININITDMFEKIGKEM